MYRQKWRPKSSRKIKKLLEWNYHISCFIKKEDFWDKWRDINFSKVSLTQKVYQMMAIYELGIVIARVVGKEEILSP